MNSVRIGTAGWSIPSRYHDDVPAVGSHLHRYAACFRAVEINTSFYRPHRQATYARWASSVPDDFRFAVKMPKAVTHTHALAGCEALVERFLDEAGGLGPKLGVILVQLPPALGFDEQVAGGFFSGLRARTPVPVVCEPRNAAWFTPEADAVLAGWGVARVAADPAPVAGAGEPGGSQALVYRRLHGAPRIYASPYGDAELDRLAAEIAATGRAGIPSWCVFDNTAAGHALGNARSLSRRLGLEADLHPHDGG